MAVSTAKIERLARALFPKYGLRKVNDMVATAVAYSKGDGCVSIGRPSGDWSWLARPASTVVTPDRVVLALRADYRRNAAMAREDIYRQLEEAIFSVMSEDEADALIAAYRKG